MGIHPSTTWIPGTFQRHVGTSSKRKPGKCGREAAVCRQGAARTSVLGNPTQKLGVQYVGYIRRGAMEHTEDATIAGKRESQISMTEIRTT